MSGRVCGRDDCAVSTGIHEMLTFGRGDLDFNGFWSEPCALCARDWERRYPEDAPCWPEDPSPPGGSEGT
jgi:hypothetical protein